MKMDRRHARRAVVLLIKFITSATFLAVIVWWMGGLEKIGKLIEGINLGVAALIVALNILDRALMTFKWLLLLKAKGITCRFFSAFRIYCASMIWGMFLPMTIGADAIRAVSMCHIGVESREVIASIVIERMIGFCAALLVGLGSLLLFSVSPFYDARFAILWWCAIGITVAGLGLLTASFSDRMTHLVQNRLLRIFKGNRLTQKLKELHETYREYRKHKRTLFGFGLLTLAEQFVPIVTAWLLAIALHLRPGILCFVVAVPLTLLISRIPVGINGLGTFEATFAFLLSFAGVTPAGAVGIAFCGRILEIAAWLPWWGAHVASTRKIGLRSDANSYTREAVLPEIEGKQG